MTPRTIPTLSVVLSTLVMTACSFQVIIGSGKVITEKRTVSGFTSFTLATIGDATITHGVITGGDTESVTIEAEDNLVPYFDVAVRGGALTIGIKNEYRGVSLHPTRPVRFSVMVKDLEGLTLAGSGNIVVADSTQAVRLSVSLLGSGNLTLKDVTASSLTLKIAGSGNASLGPVKSEGLAITVLGSGDTRIESVTAGSVITRITGSGNVTLANLNADSMVTTLLGSGKLTTAGKLTSQQIEILGSGDYKAPDLESKQATVKVSGSGSTYLKVADSLEATILGSGNVVYTGSPRITFKKAGSGAVKLAAAQ
jgi:Putative auto-transporter adhesin, head GIN domain